ncbi:hypothetical protein JXQ70_00840 [bacterium]|nr:hypothetical protein [bacterium]
MRHDAARLVRYIQIVAFWSILLVFECSGYAQTKADSGQTPRISIKTEVDRRNINLGDVFTYTITVRHDPEMSVNMPGWGANVGQFEIRDYNLEQNTDEDGSRIVTSQYSLAIYDTGTFTIPAVTINYTTKPDQEPQTLLSDSVEIVVESLAPSEADDVKDIKEQALIPPDYRLLILSSGSALLILVIIIALVYYFKKIRKKPDSKQEVYLGPAHEVARAELEALLAKKLLEQGLIKQFYFELADIIRRYLGRRFQIYTLERTTEEIQEQVQTLYLSNDVFTLIMDFLQETDLVKFAKYVPSEHEHRAIIETAQRIIDKTMIFTAPGQVSPVMTGPSEEKTGPDPEKNVGDSQTESRSDIGHDLDDEMHEQKTNGDSSNPSERAE